MSLFDRRPSRAELSWMLLFGALLLPAVAMMREASSSPRADGLPDFGAVPSFSLLERSGRELTRTELDGTPWFADFVYTNCAGSCPVLSAEMARLSRRVGDRARLVSFSVDPGRDTPKTLTEYAERFDAPADRWFFAGGEVDAMRRLIRDGFHLAVLDGPPTEKEPTGAITHSEKIVLVDAKGRIRRYYDGGNGRWIDDAVRDLEALGPAPAVGKRS